MDSSLGVIDSPRANITWRRVECDLGWLDSVLQKSKKKINHQPTPSIAQEWSQGQNIILISRLQKNEQCFNIAEVLYIGHERSYQFQAMSLGSQRLCCSLIILIVLVGMHMRLVEFENVHKGSTCSPTQTSQFYSHSVKFTWLLVISHFLQCGSF